MRRLAHGPAFGEDSLVKAGPPKTPGSETMNDTPSAPENKNATVPEGVPIAAADDLLSGFSDTQAPPKVERAVSDGAPVAAYYAAPTTVQPGHATPDPGRVSIRSAADDVSTVPPARQRRRSRGVVIGVAIVGAGVIIVALARWALERPSVPDVPPTTSTPPTASTMVVPAPTTAPSPSVTASAVPTVSVAPSATVRPTSTATVRPSVTATATATWSVPPIETDRRP